MANLYNTKVNGTIIVDTAITAGCGFQNMVVLTTGTTATYTFPTVLQVPNAKFKVTIVGAGGGGAGAPTTNIGSSGGSGAVVIVIITIVAGLYSFTYTVGGGGSGGPNSGGGTALNGLDGGDSSVLYNGITYTSGGGIGGSVGGGSGGGGGTGINGTLNIAGQGGSWGASPYTTTFFNDTRGGSTPLGLGSGGVAPSINNGIAGTGYGAGGGGGVYRSNPATGATGQPGIIILEY